MTKKRYDQTDAIYLYLKLVRVMTASAKHIKVLKKSFIFFLTSDNVTGSLYPHNGNTVNRTTCRATFSGNCCDQTIDIRIKDCGCYYVYYLKHTTGCYSAYCFGKFIFSLSPLFR